MAAEKQRDDRITRKAHEAAVEAFREEHHRREEFLFQALWKVGSGRLSAEVAMELFYAAWPGAKPATEAAVMERDQK